MGDMHILWLTRKGENYVGAPHSFHEFEQAVGQIIDCKWAGEGWNLHKPNETVEETVERVMPDADWVIVDRDNTWKTPKNRGYKVGMFLSDLHAKRNMNIHNPPTFCNLINDANFDAVFMKYMEVYGCGVDPKIFQNNLKCKVYHVPWSVNCEKHKWKRKTVDVTFIGGYSKNTYPLRHEIWDDLYYIARGYKIVREDKPRGKTFERKIGEMDAPYVGDDYIELLNRSKIMIFGCSKYRYPIQKLFESTASACLVLSDEPSTAKRLGFIDGKTYVDINEFDWAATLRYCLENYDSVKQIARTGLKNTLMNHNHKTRARDFVGMLEK